MRVVNVLAVGACTREEGRWRRQVGSWQNPPSVHQEAVKAEAGRQARRRSHSSKEPMASIGCAWMARRTAASLQNAHISLRAAVAKQQGAQTGRSVSGRGVRMPAAQLFGHCPGATAGLELAPAVQARRRVAQLQVNKAWHRPLLCAAQQRPAAVRGHRLLQGGCLRLEVADVGAAAAAGLLVGVAPMVAGLKHIVNVEAGDCKKADRVGRGKGWRQQAGAAAPMRKLTHAAAQAHR